MRVWVDAQLPPRLARRLSTECAVDALHLQDLGLNCATDVDIFLAAREAGAVVLTKDADFVRLLEQRGAPPQVVWITLGNVTNDALWSAVQLAWTRIRTLLEQNEPLVELGASRETTS